MAETSSTPKEIHDHLIRDLEFRDERIARYTGEVGEALKKDGVSTVRWAIQRLVEILGEQSARNEISERLSVIRNPSIYGLQKADPE